MSNPITENMLSEIAERAAIIEIDAKTPRDQATRLAFIQLTGLSPTRGDLDRLARFENSIKAKR